MKPILLLLPLFASAGSIELAEQLVSRSEHGVGTLEKELLAEAAVGTARVGLTLSEPQTLWVPGPEGALEELRPGSDTTHFVGIVLRSLQTGQFLPQSQVRLQVGEGDPVNLYELRTDGFPVYGTNLRLPKGAAVLNVVAGPPQYHRHGDMLGVHTGEVRHTFSLPSPANPTPLTPPGTEWGADARQAMAEARAVTVLNGVVIGFIAEGPEPVWLWEGGTTRLLPVQEADTNHLEIALFDELTGLPITGADVSLRLVPELGAPLDVSLHALMSVFYHYGATTSVPEGRYRVEVEIRPPPTGFRGPPRGQEVIRTEFGWEKAGMNASGPAGEAVALVKAVRTSASAYEGGDTSAAAEKLGEAFYAFESSQLQRLMSGRQRGLYVRLETQWVELRYAMQRGVPAPEVNRRSDSIVSLLEQGAANTEAADTSAGGMFVTSFLVLLREGFEAILLVGLLVAALRHAKRPQSIPMVWAGAGVAVAVSIVLFVLMFRFLGSLQQAGQLRELIEGITMLLAALMLAIVSHWLLSKAESTRWLAFVRDQIGGAATRGSTFTLFALAFLAVFREGVETLLFYAGLYASGDGGQILGPILGGMGAASVALVVIYFAIRRVGHVLPVRAFFSLTGALLYILAVKFAGSGMAELQAAGALSLTPVEFLPSWEWLRGLGVFPTAESLAAQGVLLVALIAGVLWLYVPRSAGSAAA